MKGNGEVRRLLIASDVDGCLLDEQTYACGDAREALASLRASEVPLVLCTSKTRAEMEVLVAELDLRWPYVVENGGALVIPSGQLPSHRGRRGKGGVAMVELGMARAFLVEQLEEIAAETGARIAGFSTLRSDDVARLTGLPVDGAARALERLYDEPFLLEGQEAPVAAAAARRGLRVTRGARFLHLTGPVDKGYALRKLLRMYASDGQRFETVGLGDAPNDLPLLRVVDRPIVVPRPLGVDAELARALPTAEQAPAPGPGGWGWAVLAVLGGRRLPQIHGASVSVRRPAS